MTKAQAARLLKQVSGAAVASASLAFTSAIATAQMPDLLPDEVISGEVVNPRDTHPATARVGTSSHYVTLPVVPPEGQASNRNDSLIVFLTGSRAETLSYRGIAHRMARRGYAVLVMNYENDQIIGDECDNYAGSASASDPCYTQSRGEVIFGRNQPYSSALPAYNAPPNIVLGLPGSLSTVGNVTVENSLMFRLVNLLDYLQHETRRETAFAPLTPVPGRSHWSQFLISSSTSPYFTDTRDSDGNGTEETPIRRYYPDWSKIVIAGHAQGAGHAAFIGVQIPVMRVVVFSSPNDHVPTLAVPQGLDVVSEPEGFGPCRSAAWMLQTSATPLTQYFGFRVADEGTYGACNRAGWANLGGIGNGGVGGGRPVAGALAGQLSNEFRLGSEQSSPPCPSTPENRTHRVVLPTPVGLPYRRHSVSAVYLDANDWRDPPDYAPTWDYVMSGALADFPEACP